MWGSNYRLLLPMGAAMYLVSLRVMVVLRRTNAEDRIGVVEEMSLSMLWSAPWACASFIIIILVDNGTLDPEPWYTVATVLYLALFSGIFVIG